MPSGACVRVYANSYHTGLMNIYIDGTPEDENNGGRGLCGNYNGIRDDDLDGLCGYNSACRQFSAQWKVPNENDLFECEKTDTLPNNGNPIPELCTCETRGGTEVLCGSPITQTPGEHK